MGPLDRIHRFEHLARQVVEGTFDRLFGRSAPSNALAAELRGWFDLLAPDADLNGRLELLMHPADLGRLRKTQPELEAGLRRYAHHLAAEHSQGVPAGFEMGLIASSEAGGGSVALRFAPASDEPETQAMRPGLDQADLGAVRRLDAFVIVNGRRHFGLDKPIINIGRKADNDLILDDAGVSRHHAQLSWRFGRFLLFDLSSTAGTLVNGLAVSESVLYPGDIISIASCSLIYGEGLAERGQAPAPPRPPDEITQAFPRSPEP
ncbi:MAG: FHA domain-containing protein [Candidatus Promineifilaceae bacterium]